MTLKKPRAFLRNLTQSLNPTHLQPHSRAAANTCGSNPLLIGIDVIHEALEIVPVAKAGLLLAHLEPGF